MTALEELISDDNKIDIRDVQSILKVQACSIMKAFETKLNIFLSTIFNQELGLSSISETRRGEGRPDILIYLGGLKILIEGSYSKPYVEMDRGVFPPTVGSDTLHSYPVREAETHWSGIKTPILFFILKL